MAKNKSAKQNERTYLQVPVPTSKNRTRKVKVDWSGLNYRQDMDTGVLSYEKNISTDEAPYLVPCENVSKMYSGNEGIISIFTSENELGFIFLSDGNLKMSFLDKNYTQVIEKKYDGKTNTTSTVVGEPLQEDNFCSSVVNFGNTYRTVTSKEVRKRFTSLLFFPGRYSYGYPMITDVEYYYDVGSVPISQTSQKKFMEQFLHDTQWYNVYIGSVSFPSKNITNYAQVKDYKGNNTDLVKSAAIALWFFSNPGDESGDWRTYCDTIPEPTCATVPTFPRIKYATVYQSRLFGIGDDKVYASGFGDYANWILDSADNISAENAWESSLSANPEADGELTAITAFQDRVIVFRENYMYEIRNTKNPFRVVDIFNEGCVSPHGYSVVNGLLLFASRYGVRMYTGARPKDIGYALGINRIYYACSGTDGVKWYLYCQTDKKEHNMFVYDTRTALWSEREINKKIISFAKTESGLFMLDDNNTIYKLNNGSYDGVEWAAETDFYSGGSIDIKHIRKIQMLAELAPNSTVNVHLLYDDEVFDELSSDKKAERLVFTKTNGDTKATEAIRFVPRKTANYRYKVRVSGTGYAKVYQMEVITSGGGELFNAN